jgi:hypothetical protein
VATEDPDHPERNPEQPSLAANIALHVTGTTTPDAQGLEALTTISLQRDLDPESAICLLTESE